MDPTALVALRHTLHQHPELSGEEAGTAARIATFLEQSAPDRLLTGLGGHGVAAVYRGDAPGPRVLLRAELDALPIPETIDLPHASTASGVAHKCGHDGHATMVASLAPLLHEHRPQRGEVVLLFQPAEETGQGASLVLADPAFAELKLDHAFALHNLPGHPLGQVVLREGVFAAASTGLVIELEGDSSHAAEPHRGRSPALAVAQLISGFTAAPQLTTALHEAAQVTVVHARVGERAFGTSPGHGAVMATLRAHDDRVLERLSARCLALAGGAARTHELQHTTEWVEPFPATVNDADAARLVAEAADHLGLERTRPEQPFPWSEDFGHFAAACPGALIGLGAGVEHPQLHSRFYDFPDQLIETGHRLLAELVHRLLDGPAPS